MNNNDTAARVLSAMPEDARAHWEHTLADRAAHGDRGCQCHLCGTMDALLPS